MIFLNEDEVTKYYGCDLFIRTTGINPKGLENELLENIIPSEYLKSCLATWNIRDNINFQLANAGLGLVGELTEYFQTRTPDEMGDILYYRAIYRYLMGDTIAITDIDYVYELHWELVIISMLADVAKKVVFHDRITSPKTRDRYNKGMTYLDMFIRYEFANTLAPVTLDEVMKMNIKKLQGRHSEGFNPNYV